MFLLDIDFSKSLFGPVVFGNDEALRAHRYWNAKMGRNGFRETYTLTPSVQALLGKCGPTEQNWATHRNVLFVVPNSK